MRKSREGGSGNAGGRRKLAKLSLSLGGGLRDAMEAYGAAAGMAEGGSAASALEILGDFHAEKRKIVVLATEGVLPEALASYSLGLAERLGFEMVLLCVFSGPAEERKGRAAARSFVERAGRRGVACAYILQKGTAEAALGAVSLTLRRVEFVVSRRPEAERRNSALLVPEFALSC